MNKALLLSSLAGVLSLAACPSNKKASVEGIIKLNGVEVSRIVTEEGMIRCLAGFDGYNQNTNTIILGQPKKGPNYEATAGIQSVKVGAVARILQHSNGSLSIGPNIVSPTFQTGGGNLQGTVRELRSTEDLLTAINDCKLMKN